jgi:hypothetical protein
MKNYLTFVLVLFVFIFLPSCQKEIPEYKEEIAMSKLKEVVGEKGEFIILNELNNIPILSFDEFKDAYKEFKKSKVFIGQADLKPNNTKTLNSLKSAFSTISLDEYEDDGPRQAGYYHASFPFYVSYYSSINDNVLPKGFYTMHLDFNTDQFGRVIGTPTLSFTGIGFFYWTYVNSSSITFNPSTTTSTFTITGNNLFGIQLGGLTLGWTERSNYYFTVNMDSDYTKNAVRVEQK